MELLTDSGTSPFPAQQHQSGENHRATDNESRQIDHGQVGSNTRGSGPRIRLIIGYDLVTRFEVPSEVVGEKPGRSHHEERRHARDCGQEREGDVDHCKAGMPRPAVQTGTLRLSAAVLTLHSSISLKKSVGECGYQSGLKYPATAITSDRDDVGRRSR